MATNQNILLVAISHGYQLKNTVGSQEIWQGLHFLQKTLNFISPSGKKSSTELILEVGYLIGSNNIDKIGTLFKNMFSEMIVYNLVQP